MVDMNTDHISDTPDRIQQSVCPVSSSAATRGVTRMAGNPSPARRIKFKIKNISTQGQSSRGDAVSELPAALHTDNIFNQAELARKLSPPKLDRTTGKSVVNGNGAHSHDLDQSSSISNHMVSRGDGVRGSSCQNREGQVGHRDASRRHVDFLGVGSDLPTGTIIIDLTDKSPTITKNGASVNYMETTASEKFRTARAGGTLIPQGANQASSSNCSEGLNNKAKEIIHPFMGTEQAGEADTMRVCPRAPVGSCFVNDDSTGISQQVWRTTHNHTIKLPMSLLCKTTSTSGMESGSSGPSNQGQETAAEDNNNSCRAATAMRSASLRNRAIRSSKRKRKHTSSSYQPGESSSSVNELGSSCLASSDTTAGRNHTTRCHNISVTDIDDISPPEARSSLSGRSNGTSIDPNVSAQLEAYELLAWQLQEQLYNETPRIAPREEIDAIVAMSVQHEEDAEWTSRTVRAPARWISNDTRAFRGGYRAARIQPIDSNDYDALLAIDENNNQHTGASESQINNLPLSVFQSTSTEEPCMVCLENPSVGDTIRTLPCFHKFHKECIDEWLRRKKQCPVCMCGITSSWPMQF